MKQLLQLYLFTFLSFQATAQVSISGQILDDQKEALIGANIYIKGTYDGSTTDANGIFSFETFESGQHILVVSFIGFETIEQSTEINGDLNMLIEMKAAFNAMEAVTISAGSFEASDERKAVVLNSLDIAMTAGSTADIVGALSTLPGTQKNAQDGRLFVRGGTAEETKVFIDGVEAANFFNTTGGSFPTRSRFSPFLFKGTYFSTGGYSAEYGQAMSSALVLESKDVEPSSRYDLSIMSVGVDVSTVQAQNDHSLYAKVGYTDLSPYMSLVSQNVIWENAPTTLDGIFSWKQNFDDGSKLRSLVMMSRSKMHFEKPTILNGTGITNIDIHNDFGFAQVTYDKIIDAKNILSVGLSGTLNEDAFIVDSLDVDEQSKFAHLKFKWDHIISEKTFIKVGMDLFHTQYDQGLSVLETSSYQIQQNRIALYTEFDHYLSENLVFRTGLRLEKDALLSQETISPRISLAYKWNDYNQLSFATGRFYQDPLNEFLKVKSHLIQERSDHYMLNFQRIKEKKIFRVEGYLKDYSDLVTYSNPFDPLTLHNNGFGYAYGLDVFWRDRGGLKNIDYWITYSYLNSERKYRDFPERSTPSFATEHNVSVVAKRWFSSLKTQMGITYSFSSGRPYDHPERDGFNESLTSAFHDVSYNVAWLPNKHLIVYLSVSNILGLDQTFGYDFAESPDKNGLYQSEAVQLPAPRFLFLGCFLTLGQANDQLENL